jgi:hypothetical protein
MKFLNIIALIAFQATGILSSPAPAPAPAPAEAAAATLSAIALQCGSLGVMEVNATRLPQGVDPNNIRTCADHPANGSPGPEQPQIESRDDLTTANSPNPLLAKRDCYFGASHGCSKGYCWKACGLSGSGQWCWTAFNNGYGNWIGCSDSSQCNTGQACGIGANCSKCGCSC